MNSRIMGYMGQIPRLGQIINVCIILVRKDHLEDLGIERFTADNREIALWSVFTWPRTETNCRLF
jgi:hypothetical protein